MKRAFHDVGARALTAVIPAVGLLTLGGCGSSANLPDLRAAPPTIYLQSLQTPSHVSHCLERQLSTVQTVAVTEGESAHDNVALLIDRGAWLIEISAASGGTRVAAHRGNDGERIEPDVRFAIARCTL